MRDHFALQFFVALGFGGLALQRIHLAADFFQNVEDARQVLLRAFELGFGQPLLGFEFGDAGRFFDHGAAVLRFVAEDLADAALLDDGVAFRTEAGAHEEVLDVAQAGDFAVDQIFAFAGPEQAARDGDFEAWLPCGVHGRSVAICRSHSWPFSWLAGSAWRTGSTSVMVTDAMPSGLRSRVPAKMTSSIRVPRRLLADCSPSTQLMASLRFDFPQPFGPTMAAIPEPVEPHLGLVEERFKALNLDSLELQQNDVPLPLSSRGMALS